MLRVVSSAKEVCEPEARQSVTRDFNVFPLELKAGTRFTKKPVRVELEEPEGKESHNALPMFDKRIRDSGAMVLEVTRDCIVRNPMGNLAANPLIALVEVSPQASQSPQAEDAEGSSSGSGPKRPNDRGEHKGYYLNEILKHYVPSSEPL